MPFIILFCEEFLLGLASIILISLNFPVLSYFLDINFINHSQLGNGLSVNDNISFGIVLSHSLQDGFAFGVMFMYLILVLIFNVESS